MTKPKENLLAARFQISLRSQIILILSMAILTGAVAGGSWYKWNNTWERHLANSYKAGVSLFELVQEFRDDPTRYDKSRLTVFDLSVIQPVQTTSADNSVSLQFPDLAGRRFETKFSILDFGSVNSFEGNRISIRIFSRKLKYSLTTIPNSQYAGLSSRFGSLVRALTSFCGDTIMFTQIDEKHWLRIGGDQVWSCDIAPKDPRLFIIIISGILFGGLLTIGLGSADNLEALSAAIKLRAKDGLITPISTKGPKELRAIAGSVNDFFDREKDRLEKRAHLLSGISHDLGTPATRLKLRAALIDDVDLRVKLERDIDQITTMIESVLAYTRNEMNLEEPRRVSLISLVQSVVDDYADIGQPVTFIPLPDISIVQPRTIFGSAAEKSRVDLSNQYRLLCSCRPNAIRRALSNLIDNAIKYGKSAEISLQANSETISISIQDAGGSTKNFDFEKMIEPFKRGSNATYKDGIGLGLTIVSNIALSHGGQLNFDGNPQGTCATLILPR